MIQLHNHRILIILLSITLIGVFPLDVILPSFPALAKHFSKPITDISLSLGIFVAGFSLSQLVIGPLSDIFGRKKLLIAGLFIASIGATGVIFTEDFHYFLIFRSLQAVGCGCFVLVNALVQDFYSSPERHKARILTTTAGGFFIATAPVLGIILQSIGNWRGSFIFFVIFSGMVIFAIDRWIPSTVAKIKINGHRDPRTKIGATLNRAFLENSVLSAIGFSCHFAFIVQSPIIFLEKLSLSQNEYAIVLLCYGTAYVIGGIITKRISGKITLRRQIMTGLLTMVSAGILPNISTFAFSDSSIAVLATMIICTCGITILRPAATTAAMDASPHQPGAAASFHNTIIFMVGAAVSTMVTLAPVSPIFSLGTTICLLSLLGLITITLLPIYKATA